MIEEKTKHEYPCLVKKGESVNTGNCQADVTRTDENTITVYLANGGYVRLTSDTPIKAVIEPNGD